MLKDRYVQEATALFKSVTLALVGIGAVEPSKLLAASGNVFSPHELKSLSARGAVGDICLRFFDAAGVPVQTPLNDRVISMELSQLKQVRRVVGIAGGKRKTAAIRGALAGGWINTLITDRSTAERLIRARVQREGTKASPRMRTKRSRRGLKAALVLAIVAGALAILRPWTIVPIQSTTARTFDPDGYVTSIWESRVLPTAQGSAIELRTFMESGPASRPEGRLLHGRKCGPGGVRERYGDSR